MLKDMRREYTIEEFRRVCDYLLKYVPNITIATDIICGFPGETEEDFEQTIKLVQDYKFPVLNISKFYPRPGTPAAKMKRIGTDIVKNRSTRLTRLFESYSCYDYLLGQEVDVWFSEEVNTLPHGKQSIGHTREYIKVVVEFDETLPGARKQVRVTSTHKFHVVGSII